MTEFVNLHNRTYFSILTALPSPKDYLLRAKELDQKAVAITDCGSMAGVWDAFKAYKEIGVKLIIGCEFYFVDTPEDRESKLRFIILIAKNHTGYKNILLLNKKGFEYNFTIGKKVAPVLNWNLLKEHSDGIICLTGCGNGVIGQLLNLKKFDEAESALLKLHEIFGDNLGVEIQAHNLQRNATHHSEQVNQIFTNMHLIRLAEKHNLRIVPTSNSHYLKKEDAETHDVMLAIGSMQPVYSNARIKYNVSDMYPKTGDEIKTFFSRNYSEEFATKICKNSIYFADMCENPDWIDPKFSNASGKELPVFPIDKEPDYENFKHWLSKKTDLQKLDEDKSFLRFRCWNAFIKKVPTVSREEYRKRLLEELDVIEYCGVSSYMLITADLVDYAKKNGIPVGPGRGSVGGSLIAYLLGIHAADPIKYGLVFPRFFSKLRASYADIDQDFSKEKRDLILNYISSKYGADKFAQISNFIYITPKVYARDITRSCELAGTRADSVKLGTDIADIIPKKDINDKEVRSYSDIEKSSPLFLSFVDKYPRLKQYSDICEKPRSLGIHAAGVLISNRPISSIVPTRIDKDKILSVQLDKNGVEEAGLVKMDILGLETLDIIDKANDLIKEKYGKAPEVDYEAYDEKTYNLISSGNTYGVFQFGTSAGTVDLCKKIKPKSIEDLAIITTLARPASKDIREAFIKAREKKSLNKLIHKSLENSLKDTYGFPLYDESLLVLAKDVAGWDLAEADKLRKLTKEKGKNPKKAEQWRTEFIEGAVKNGVDKESAINIWHDIIEPFGKYSFNKCFYPLQEIDTYTMNGDFICSKYIKDIQVGEYVRSRDEETKSEIFVEVKNKYNNGEMPLFEVELLTGEVIKCTMNHKFRTKENGEMIPLWIIIKDNLSIIVNTVDKNTNIKNIKYIGEDQTYDIEVDHKDHQFYLANGVLTSNSHAVLYSMVSYHTAYLKAHYPIEFLLANLMAEVRSAAKVAKENIERIKQELRNNGIKINPPDINKSNMQFEIQKSSGELLTGFDVLKSVGDDAIKDIIDKRPYSNFNDFMLKVNSTKVRSNTIQSLAASGCLDSFKLSRKSMYLYCSDYRKKLQIWLKKHDPKIETFEYEWPKDKEWSLPELYALEKETLGEGLICGKDKAYINFFDGKSIRIKDIKNMVDKERVSSIKAEIKSIFEFKVKKQTSKYLGEPMIKAVIEDEFNDQITLTIFPDKWKEVKKRMNNLTKKNSFKEGIAIHFSGNVNVYEDEVGLVLDNFFNYAPSPSLPKDLKSKKINKINKDNIVKDISLNKTDELIEDFVDDLFNEGFIDLDSENDD